jgi:hypothetical protein
MGKAQRPNRAVINNIDIQVSVAGAHIPFRILVRADSENIFVFFAKIRIILCRGEARKNGHESDQGLI